MEWVKRSTLRWLGHIEGMGNEEFVMKVYLSSVKDTNRRGRLLGRCKDRVREYVSERGVRGNGLEWARRGCMDIGEVKNPSAVATPFGDISRGSEKSELLID